MTVSSLPFQEQCEHEFHRLAQWKHHECIAPVKQAMVKQKILATLNFIYKKNRQTIVALKSPLTVHKVD